VLEQVLRLRPDLVIVDSIQTLYSNQIESTPGSVAQIRETAGKLMQVAKSTGIPFFLIGHITKDGALAGPKLLEHMVDTVLTFEGDRHQQFRIIRTLKNRFGSTMELGVYEMTEKGLTPVLNPSELFMSHMSDPTPGIAVAATLEGSRTLLLEIQALVTESAYGSPQRSATGYDQRRLNMMLAVLEKKCGFRLGNRDVFLNFTGGIRSEDPAVDLAVAVAVASSLLDIPVPPLTIFSAEVGLTGEIRPVPRIAQRIAEAGRMGFHTLITAGDKPEIETSVQLPTYSQLTQVFNAIFTDK
jgi:DNA repair protein RadA/Sms